MLGTMGISAKEEPLGKVFTSDYRFVIPSFQRAYSWREENILQLVGDLADACTSPEVPYFLGSLILVHDEGALYEVIDGQQRLVSLSIIVAVLRELEDDPDLAERLDELILEPGDKLRGIMAEPRLRLRDRDADFFREYVQEGNLEGLFDLRESDIRSNAQRNIEINTKRTYDAIAAMDDDSRHRFASYLVNGVTLVIVTSDDLTGAHRIFDVMNMRGLPLTSSDVFKAKIVEALSPAARDVYAARWDDIMDPLGDDPGLIGEFFGGLHLIVSHKAMCGRLIDEFRDDVLKPYLEDDRAIAFVDDVLAPYANAWRMVERPGSTALPSDVVDRLTALRDYPRGDWKPVAMWALVHCIRGLGMVTDPLRPRGTHARQYGDGVSGSGDVPELHDRDLLCGILDALERVCGVDSLNRKSELERRTRMASAVRDLDRGLGLRRIRGFMISDDDRRTALAHLRGELQCDDAFKRLLLIRANERLCGGRIVRPRSLNALRILPERVGRTSSFASWPESVRDYWVDRIGNMVLSQTNGRQLDKFDGYADRRDRLLLSSSSRRFPLTAQLSDIAELSPETLRRRQEETVRLIAEYWNIRYDSGHEDLSALPEERLSGTVKTGRPTSRRVTIGQVLEAGLLVPGETLVWDRPRKGERWVAVVTADGRMRLEDGNEYATPTAAARAVGGGAFGLNVWRRASNGQKLGDIWKTYRLHH